MTISETIPELQNLSKDMQLQLASELWEKNINRLTSPESEEAMDSLLNQRLAEYEANPNATISLNDLRRKYGANS